MSSYYHPPKNELIKIKRHSGLQFSNYLLRQRAKSEGQTEAGAWGVPGLFLSEGIHPQPLEEFREEMGMKCLSKCMNGITNRRLLRLSGHPHAQKEAQKERQLLWTGLTSRPGNPNSIKGRIIYV